MHMGTFPGWRYTPRGVLPDTRSRLFSFFLKLRSKTYPRITNFDSVGGHRIGFVHFASFLNRAKNGPNKRGGKGVK